MRTKLFTFLVFVSLTAYAQNVKTTQTPGVDMNSFTTFRVDKGELVTVSDQKVDEKKFHQRIKQAIISALTEKGYQFVDDSTAQLVVNYVGEAVTKMDVENLGPLGQQPATNASQVDASRSWSHEYEEGSLAIDIQDARQKKTVWRSNGTVNTAIMEDERAINSIIYKSFKKFPFKKKRR
jgi:hypothetical protein